MKPELLAFSFIIVLGDAVVPLGAATDDMVPGDRGPHHQTWQRVSSQTRRDGSLVQFTNSYIQLGTHMHYWKDNEWKPSRAHFQIFPGGEAVAQEGAFQMIVAPDIAQEGAVDLLTPDSHRFLSNPRWLAMTDLLTGQSAIIAAVKSCVGQLVEPNVIVFPDAFDDVYAMIRVTYQPYGMEQDVILMESGPLLRPADHGLNGDPANIVLEIWSEFHAAPDPDRTVTSSQGGLSDVSLGFGQSLMGEGRAFSMGQEDTTAFVGKTWTRIDQKQFLIESVRHLELVPLLVKLPLQAQARNPAQAVRGMAAHKVVNGRNGLLAEGRAKLKPVEKRAQMAAIQPNGRLPTQAAVIDYSILASASNVRLRGDTTYVVTNLVTFSGTTILDGGAVIKYTNRTNGGSPRIQFNGSIDCRTSPGRPAFFTGVDDNTVGETISGSTGSPGTNRYGLRAFELFGVNSTWDIHDVHIRYPDKAFQGMSSGITLTLSHSQIGNVNYAFHNAAPSMVKARNILIHDSFVAINNTTTSTNVLEHLTAHGIRDFRTDTTSGAVYLTNSLLISVTNFVAWSGSNVETNLSDSGIFQTVGAGGRYLASRSPYRDVGTTNTSILTDLRSRTTFPPIVLSGSFGFDTVLGPQAKRDVDTPDLGYHFDCADWAIASANLTNVTLTLTGGVSVIVYGGNPALTLFTGAKFISRGDPAALNRLMPYAAVQEQPVAWGANLVPTLFDLGETTPATAPQVDLRFTAIDLANGLAGSSQKLLDSQLNLARLCLVDSQLRGGRLSLIPDHNYSQTQWVAFSNSFVQWTSIDIEQGHTGDTTPMEVNLRNCLFSTNSMIVLSTATAPVLRVHDNLFDTVSHLFAVNQSLTNSYNGYYATTTLPSPTTGNVTLSTLDFQTGLLGPWYYPASGTGLNTLRDAGSRNATNAALYAFTTTTNNVAETNSVVDIGYHSAAGSWSGWAFIPLDTDGDGIPDWQEDLNLNGSYDASAGETDWQTYNSRFGIGSGPGLVVFTPLK